ncbi:ankyrin repeat domain-containing protein [Legionella sp. WA2024007413]
MYTRRYFVDALIKAIKENNFEDVIDLVRLINERSPASLFACDEENKTLLHLALATGDEELSNFLFNEMKNNKVIYTKDHELRTVFWYAAKDSFCDIFIKLLNQAKKDEQQTLIFACDIYKSTLLHKTAWLGQLKIIDILFHHVISDKDNEFINQADDDGNTALHKCYQVLLDCRKEQPIDEESIKKHIQIIVILFKNGADLHLFNNENITPFMLHRQLPIRDQEHILLCLKSGERAQFLRAYAQLFEEQKDKYDPMVKSIYIRYSGTLSLVELVRANYLCNPRMIPRALYLQSVSVPKDQILSYEARGYAFIESDQRSFESEKGKEIVEDRGDKNDEDFVLMIGQEIIPDSILVEMPRAFKDNLKSDTKLNTVARSNISKSFPSSSITYHYQHSNNDRLVLNCLIKQMEDYLADLQRRTPQADPCFRAATISMSGGSICCSLVIILYFIYRAVDAYQYLKSHKEVLDYETRGYYREQVDLYGALAILTPWLLLIPVVGISTCSANFWNIEKKIANLEYQRFIERLELISNKLADMQGLHAPIYHDIHVQLLRDIGLLKQDQYLEDTINIFTRCIEALKVIRRDVTNNEKLSAYSIFSRREIVITVNESTPLQHIPPSRLTYGTL